MRVTIKYPDENWSPWGQSGDNYKPIEYAAELINVIRMDGKWIGIIGDEHGIRQIDMAVVVEWEGHDSHYYPKDW